MCPWVSKVDLISLSLCIGLSQVSLPSSCRRVSHDRDEGLIRVKEGREKLTSYPWLQPSLPIVCKEVLEPHMIWWGLGGLVSLWLPELLNGLAVDDCVPSKVMLKEQWRLESDLEEAHMARTKDDSAVTFMNHPPGPGSLTDASVDTNVDRWRLRTRCLSSFQFLGIT